MAPVDPNINFDCPECEERLAVSSDKVGNQIYCPHCGDQVHVPKPMSTVDKLLTGLIDEDEIDHPGSLKIDGISSDVELGTSWNITCHVCDSVLLVTQEQVGAKVKCNDCYTMLTVRPRKNAPTTDGVADGSTLEIVEDVPDESPTPKPTEKSSSDIDELTLAPEVDLPTEFTAAQKETYLDEIDEEEGKDSAATDEPIQLTPENLESEDDEPILLTEPVGIAKAPKGKSSGSLNPMFAASAPSSAEEDDEDDSDEEIEMLDVAPEELNQQEDFGVPDVAPVATPKQLPRVPRKGRQPAAIPVQGEDDEAPVRVHAKRRPKSEPAAAPQRKSNKFEFDEAPFGEVMDKAFGVLKSGKVMLWMLIAIAIMATGGAIWQWLGPDRLDPETSPVSQRILFWGAGYACGQAVFFVGYIILLFVGGVIFRETALGQTKVDSVSCTDAADFTSTMLLFGFSMFIAALPCMMLGWMFLTIPVQFFLAGVFLFAAWKNQGAFLIVSASIFESFSKHLPSWKNWAMGALLAAAGGMIGGGLMEVTLPILSVFTSIAGAILVALVTLFFAAISGWHCGTCVEKLRQAE